MIFSPSQHSSSSRWGSAAAPPCVALAFTSADASAVAAGKRGAPAPQHGWQKRKRFNEEEEHSEAAEPDFCSSKRARAGESSIALEPVQALQPVQPAQPSRPPTLDEVHSWQSGSSSSAPPATSVVAAAPSAWVRVERPYGAAYERAAPVAPVASAPLGACPDMDMDCAMDYESETHTSAPSRAGSTPATPPDSPCDMWERIEGDGGCAASQQATACGQQQQAATLAWLQLQVGNAAHPHPYASPTPSPNTHTFDAQNRVQLGSGYFARAFF